MAVGVGNTIGTFRPIWGKKMNKGAHNCPLFPLKRSLSILLPIIQIWVYENYEETTLFGVACSVGNHLSECPGV